MTGRRAITALRFLIRSLSLRGSPFLLALLAITVGATVTATMLNIKLDLQSKMSKDLRRYGPNLLVVPSNEGRAGATLDSEAMKDLPRVIASAQIRGSVVISPLLIALGMARAASQPPSTNDTGEASLDALGRMQRNGVPVTIVGADFEALEALNASWRVEGRWPRDRGDEGHGVPCLVGAAAAHRLGLAPGRPLEILAGSSALVATPTGIVSTGEAEDEQIFLPLAPLQRATNNEGRVSLAALSIDGGDVAVTRAATAVETAVPGAAAHPLRQIAAAQGAILAKLERMMVLLTAVVLVLSGLCLVTTLMAIVVEREGEIGLMRSIGAGDGQILGMFLGEVGLLGLTGGIAGLGLGAGGARLIGTRLFNAAIEPRLESAPWVIGLSLGLCFVAVLLPLRRALAVQPAVALRGE